MIKAFPYVSSFNDRHGKRRYRFRRKGYPPAYFHSPFGTKEFEREYAAFLEAEKPSVGAARIRSGSVSDVIVRYYSDTAFQDLKPATQNVYRGVLERFRKTFGDDPIARFDAGRIQNLMNKWIRWEYRRFNNSLSRSLGHYSATLPLRFRCLCHNCFQIELLQFHQEQVVHSHQTSLDECTLSEV